MFYSVNCNTDILVERNYMKISTSKDTILPVISKVVRAISSKPTDPAMAGIKLEVKVDAEGNATLYASAYDGETAIMGELPVTVDGEIQELRPSGNALYSVLKDLPEGEVSLEGDSSQILIRAGRGKFKIPQFGISPLDPKSLVKPLSLGDLTGEKFTEAVNKVIVASSKNSTLPSLNSVKIEAGNDKLRFVSTDRYRLAVYDLPWSSTLSEKKSILFSNKTMSDMVKSYGKSLKLSFGFSETLGFMNGDNVESLFRVIGGDLPAYEKLLAPEKFSTATFDATEFRDSLKRVTKFNNESVKVTLNPNFIKLENNGSQDGEGSEEIDGTFSQVEESTISFNPNYLLDCFNNLDGKVEMKFEGSQKPAIFTSSSQPNYTHLVMPVAK